MVHVSFDNLTVSLEDVHNSPARYARQLKRAKKSPGYAQCQCNAAGAGQPLRLVVRRYGALFHLARWPDEGPHHNSKCPFYAGAAATGKSKSDAADAIQHTPTGLNVKLDATLFVKTVETLSPPVRDHFRHRQDAPCSTAAWLPAASLDRGGFA
ncbi:DUF1173 family protein [Caballeronia sp. S22]|uniref:DUF1173 family protein n=1 Tax=Caballeronia sp. S22 TaxID=3137182 RepID=UPI0035307B07